MIRLSKGAKPQVLVVNEVQWNADYVAYVTQNTGSAACETRHRHPEIRSAVMAESSGKCIYCEEKVLSSQYGDVEHLKPKRRYPHYYVSWPNLGLSCVKCNSQKKEKEGLIDPFHEEPGDYIEFRGPMIFYKRGSEKGRLTVRGIKLNRPALLEKRAKSLESFIDKIDLMDSSPEPIKSVLWDEIQDDIKDDAEFAGLLRGYYYSLFAHDAAP